MRYLYFMFCGVLLSYNSYSQTKQILTALSSPIIFRGDSLTAYRDPAILYDHDLFYLFYTYVSTEADHRIFSQIGVSTSKDLVKWSTKKMLTSKDQQLDYSSPGNVIRFGDEWILCFQSYPRPNHYLPFPVRYGEGTARLYIMRSRDLKNWSEPELLRVKGNEVSQAEMGRMIDPYLLEDRDIKGKWWCFYKQNGVSISYTYDFITWTYFGKADAGENVCVLKEQNDYVMFHSPQNGIAIKRSVDMKNWNPWGSLITLGQDGWPWAKGRITAGTVIDLRSDTRYGKYVMFFHGSGPLTENEGDFDKNASIGIAWSNDLVNWEWPQK